MWVLYLIHRVCQNVVSLSFHDVAMLAVFCIGSSLVFYPILVCFSEIH
jgi:hypothetical protein